jgi:uncharacterized protein YndB with AHSA1/START domain
MGRGGICDLGLDFPGVDLRHRTTGRRMKVLNMLLGRLILGVVVLVGVGLALPSQLHMARRVTIEAPPARVFPLINDLHAFNRWSPWAQRDPQAKYTFEGPESGVGARMTWSSDHPDVGSGSLQVLVSEPDQKVVQKLDLGYRGTATVTYALKPEGQGTLVSLALDMDFGYNLVDRYFGLLQPRWTGPEYQKALSNLKSLAEGKTGPTPAAPSAGWRMATPDLRAARDGGQG